MATATVEKKQEVKKVVKEPNKKICIVDMSSLKPVVTFQGKGWRGMDIKIMYPAIVRGFKEHQRELTRGVK